MKLKRVYVQSTAPATASRLIGQKHEDIIFAHRLNLGDSQPYWDGRARA